MKRDVSRTLGFELISPPSFSRVTPMSEQPGGVTGGEVWEDLGGQSHQRTRHGRTSQGELGSPWNRNGACPISARLVFESHGLRPTGPQMA